MSCCVVVRGEKSECVVASIEVEKLIEQRAGFGNILVHVIGLLTPMEMESDVPRIVMRCWGVATQTM